MARRMARRRYDRHAAVAEDVAIALELGHRMLRLEARAALRIRPFILGLLHQQHRFGEQLDIAGMIRMRVRYGDEFDVIRPDAERIKLRGERLRPAPGDAGR